MTAAVPKERGLHTVSTSEPKLPGAMLHAPLGPPSFDESLAVSTLAVGIFQNYGGGFLARFALTDGRSRLLAFSSAQAFDARDQFRVAMTHFERHGFVREPIQRVLPLPPEDFDHREKDSEVGAWFLNMGSDGALWRVLTRGGADIVLRLTPSQMSSCVWVKLLFRRALRTSLPKAIGSLRGDSFTDWENASAIR